MQIFYFKIKSKEILQTGSNRTTKRRLHCARVSIKWNWRNIKIYRKWVLSHYDSLLSTVALFQRQFYCLLFHAWFITFCAEWRRNNIIEITTNSCLPSTFLHTFYVSTNYDWKLFSAWNSNMYTCVCIKVKREEIIGKIYLKFLRTIIIFLALL